jgi:phospholipid/cholesterol/gamma-HCH transport system ATP-binding protein
MSKFILEVKDVTIELGGEVIFEKINLNVLPQETIVLIGPSGGGKTVLLKTLAGIYEPIRGEVRCYGHQWSNLSSVGRHDLARKVGMQFQKGALFDDLSTFDNVAYPLREHEHFSETQIKERVLACLKAVNLEKAQDLLPHELSGGMRLRLGVARSIVLKPEILFMDDPTAGLDPISSDDMAELILKLKAEVGATLIIATHDILRAYQFAGRIILVANKTILETGSAEQTKTHASPAVQQFLHGWQKGPLTSG